MVLAEPPVEAPGGLGGVFLGWAIGLGIVFYAWRLKHKGVLT